MVLKFNFADSHAMLEGGQIRQRLRGMSWVCAMRLRYCWATDRHLRRSEDK